jgi:DNA-binding XRE family transcriptional regulator
MDQPDQSFDLAPKHVRAARALLAWSQQDLAKAASVATSTVADFERGRRTPVANNAQAMRSALEGAGIRFMPTGAVTGPVSPTSKALGSTGMPVRWVNADGLSKWADRIDGAYSLPTLIAHLIRATHGSVDQLRFPANEGALHSGWDGRTSTNAASEFVPQGNTGWELSSQRDKISTKAMQEYRKRTEGPGPLDPKNAAFVFVTLRNWPKKDEWAQARQSEGVWREVRAYDASNLVHWLEQAPAVGLWLACRLGERPPGTRELDECWEEWSLATEWPLNADLVLSDRDQDAADVQRWLRGQPAVMSLQATTTDEVVAFFHATLSMFPDDVAAVYRARSLVATTAASARALRKASAPLFLLLTEPEPGLAQTLVLQGHHVLQAYDERPVTAGDVRSLARPSREGIAAALVAAGIAEPRAQALARDSAGNLTILRRRIPSAPGRPPVWAQNKPPQPLLAALLAGGWDEKQDGDRVQLAKLAEQPYESLTAGLTAYVGRFDSPLQKVGSTWRVASPYDAWFLLAPHLTGADITRFESAAHAVLGSVDARFGMMPNKRWMAAIQNTHPAYSGLLRHGIGQVLILLSLWGDKAQIVADAKSRADAIVKKLLHNADPARWWSLSREFRLLAEASPKAFLSAIDHSLDQPNPPIRALFDKAEEGVLGAEYLSDLLWALESLAWSPDLLPEVTLVLARLDALDDAPGRHANRPSNSLRSIHLLWLPQTFATLDQRLRALDRIRKQQNESAWKLMLSVLPKGHDSAHPSPPPRWRSFDVGEVEVVTWGLMRRGAAAIAERLLVDVQASATRWSQLLDRFADLPLSPDAGLLALEAAEKQITDTAERGQLWASLRRVLHHHRQFSDAEWSMPSVVLDRLELVYERFAPADPIQRVAWLFAQSVDLPKASTEGWETEERDVDNARKRAVRSLYSEGGVTAILALARQVETAGFVGKAVYECKLSSAQCDAMLETVLRSEEECERDIAHGLIVSIFRDQKEDWAAGLINKAKSAAWGDTALRTILHALPSQRWTWDQVALAGADIERTYWLRAPVWWIDADRDNVIYAIRKMLAVGRARHALALAASRKKTELPSDLLVDVLQQAASQPLKGNADANESTMFQYNVAEIILMLDARDDVDDNTLVGLEWRYLPVLEYSRRPAKALLKALSQSPPLFIQMLSAVFKASEESGVENMEPDDPERAGAVAKQAYQLLRAWNRLPGTRDDGTINGHQLEAWIKEVRSLANKAGRADIADDQIGNMLSASKTGKDGHWPAEAVRDVIDLFHSKPMIDGFVVGKCKRRGTTVRDPGDGGDLERMEEETYRNWAKAIAYDHPHTAKALDALAQSYASEARREDESAERRDWGQ